MTEEMKLMINTILEEMERMENRLNKKMDKRFDQIERHLDSMQHEINACKLERDSFSLLMRKIDQLEEKIA